MFNHADFYTLQKWVTADEGLELRPYHDSNGILTVMIGINLEAGFTIEECVMVLQMRLKKIFNQLVLKLPWIVGLLD
jgi:GH24 family phage-related lysozyme (muramidase)